MLASMLNVLQLRKCRWLARAAENEVHVHGNATSRHAILPNGHLHGAACDAASQTPPVRPFELPVRSSAPVVCAAAGCGAMWQVRSACLTQELRLLRCVFYQKHVKQADLNVCRSSAANRKHAASVNGNDGPGLRASERRQHSARHRQPDAVPPATASATAALQVFGLRMCSSSAAAASDPTHAARQLSTAAGRECSGAHIAAAASRDAAGNGQPAGSAMRHANSRAAARQAAGMGVHPAAQQVRTLARSGA